MRITRLQAVIIRGIFRTKIGLLTSLKPDICSLTTLLHDFFCFDDGSSSGAPQLLESVVKTKKTWSKIVNEHVSYLRVLVRMWPKAWV